MRDADERALAGRRAGEAHLWLLFEESIASARRQAASDPSAWEARRSFHDAAEALVAVGAVAPATADAIAQELDDALALRGHLPASEFSGAAFPEGTGPASPANGDPRVGVPGSTRAQGSKARAAEVWLEAEIVRHLDLLAGMDAESRRVAGAQSLTLLRGPARALAAWSGRTDADDLVRELAASLAAAGLVSESVATPPRPAWVRLLRLPALPPPSGHPPTAGRDLRVPLGSLAGAPATLTRVAWSADAVELRVRTAAAAGLARSPLEGPRARPPRWLARVVEPVAGLHAGQAGRRTGDEVVFNLRPGLREVAAAITVTVTAGPDAATVEVAP